MADYVPPPGTDPDLLDYEEEDDYMETDGPTGPAGKGKARSPAKSLIYKL